MRRMIVKIWLMLMSVALVSCSNDFTVEFSNNRSAVIHIDMPCSQCLWLPIEDGAPSADIDVAGSGVFTVPLRVRLAVDSVQYYMPLRIDEGVKEIRITGCSFESVAWDALKLQERNPQEVSRKYRQKIHFTPDIGWINDPNGMVWYDGEWHLFYQYNPFGARWSNMSWGHAVSRDLVNWEILPVALYPDELGQIYSGSAVIDKYNTAGFGENAMVAIYTSSGKYQTQSLAYSTDRGRTFTKYKGNPVLPSERADFRDPKVFWHEPTSRWIMPLACADAMEFYSSPDLKNWTFESRFGDGYGCHGGEWECPDLIELPYKDTTKWVLLCSLRRDRYHGSSVQYFVGDFDGHTFKCDTPENETRWISYGRDNYALVTWSNAPDERKVAMGWQNNWQYAKGKEFPSHGFRGYMTLAYDMTLIEHKGFPKLILRPVPEYDEFFVPVVSVDEILLHDCYNVYQGNGDSLPVSLECSLSDITADIIGLRIFNNQGEYVEISFNMDRRVFSVDRSNSGNCSFHEGFSNISVAPVSDSDKQSLKVIIDQASVECFTDIAATSDIVFPKEPFSRISFYCIGGSAKVSSLEISEFCKK